MVDSLKDIIKVLLLKFKVYTFDIVNNGLQFLTRIDQTTMQP